MHLSKIFAREYINLTREILRDFVLSHSLFAVMLIIVKNAYVHYVGFFDVVMGLASAVVAAVSVIWFFVATFYHLSDEHQKMSSRESNFYIGVIVIAIIVLQAGVLRVIGVYQ